MENDTYSLIAISTILYIIQYLSVLIFDVAFIKLAFYGYISSSSIDIKFFNIILVLGYIRFELAPILWVSFYKVIGVIFKISVGEVCLSKDSLIALKDVLISLNQNFATISSEQHLYDTYSIYFQNLNLEDFDKICPYLFIFCKESEPIIFQVLIDLIQYRLDSSYLFGFEFTASNFSAASNNDFKCFIEYIWLLNSGYIQSNEFVNIINFLQTRLV
jgi:hypothetical protein